VVTFLFTEVEGSTRRWDNDADAMRAALVAHDEVLRAAIEAHGGFMFKHTGDGVCAAFASRGGAVDAAVAGWPDLPIPPDQLPCRNLAVCRVRCVSAVVGG
jgi:class 3 adenylate cyclase